MNGRGARPCGALSQADGSAVWRVWAPHARHVELVLIDGGRRRAVAMQPEGDGYFTHREANVDEGQRYAFRLNNGPERPDPASRWQPDGVHAPSAVLRPERFPWSDRPWTGIARQDLVLYELHVGTFTPEGTFDAIVPRLASLRELGVTAIEIMPVAQFPGARNWGYDGVHPHAVQNTYGGPHGLQRLVDACHAAGLALFVDVVYNHLGPEGNYLREYGPYFTDRYRTPWGPALNYDGPDSGPVRDLILDNVRLWFADYRVDGLRLDATHAIHDSSPVHILRAIKETAEASSPLAAARRAHVIAEDLRNEVKIVRPPEQGGYGLDAQWNDDLHHALHAYLTGERQGYYVDFGRAGDIPRVLERTFLLDGVPSRYRGRTFGTPAGDVAGDRFVVYVQTHDQVGNRARGDRLSTLLHNPAQLRLMASVILLSPHLPLLFMGEEYGEERPFPFFCSFLDGRLIDAVRKGRRRDYAAFMEGEMPDPQAEATFAGARLSWSWPEGTPRAGLRHLYADLLAARRQWPVLRDFVQRSAHLLPDGDHGPVLHLVRGELGASTAIEAFFNLSMEPQLLPDTSRPREPSGASVGAARLAAPTGPRSQLLFTSEAARYHGSRQDGASVEGLLANECLVFGGPGARG